MVWDKQSLECLKILTGHTGSVLCLQYDERVIVTGSSDSTVRVWNVTSGEVLNTLIHHNEAVLHLRFCNGLMVTCSKDRSIGVWDMASPTDISLRRVLVGHRAAVNVVDFDDKYIVSASGDRTIKVWSTSTCEFVRTLNGHKRGIACLQYRDRLVVSGSSDNTIRLWDIECGACLRVLEGHEELVRCIRFDNKRIVSGAYDGKIKVWDLQAALDPRAPASTLCLRTLVEHSGRVFRLQGAVSITYIHLHLQITGCVQQGPLYIIVRVGYRGVQDKCPETPPPILRQTDRFVSESLREVERTDYLPNGGGAMLTEAPPPAPGFHFSLHCSSA
ncbi:hypothetical protein SKAU_G00320640 [Synaphobranchus kaupii]|uniref:TEP-1 second beta-propeller domain-containing protein n=1 Tax=Synaphobranchus kaupii TaxID=118154 RepID=A0A9Q1IJR3_SYNKA|nr:hypothetical protein SKAU_G00320640 [Synaphobranchus kaupii]